MIIKNSAICLITEFKGNKHIMLVKTKNNGKLGLPGGRIDSGESIREAAAREFLEEVGTSFTSSTFNKNIKHLLGKSDHVDMLGTRIYILKDKTNKVSLSDFKKNQEDRCKGKSKHEARAIKEIEKVDFLNVNNLSKNGIDKKYERIYRGCNLTMFKNSEFQKKLRKHI